MGGRSLGRATRERAQFHGDGELVRQGFYGGWLSRHESRVEEEEEAWNREKEREKQRGKGRNAKKRKEGEDLSFPHSIPAQLEEGLPGHLSSWAERRSPSLPSPWMFSLQPSAEQADSSHPRTLPCS